MSTSLTILIFYENVSITIYYTLLNLTFNKPSYFLAIKITVLGFCLTYFINFDSTFSNKNKKTNFFHLLHFQVHQIILL